MFYSSINSPHFSINNIQMEVIPEALIWINYLKWLFCYDSRFLRHTVKLIEFSLEWPVFPDLLFTSQQENSFKIQTHEIPFKNRTTEWSLCFEARRMCYYCWNMASESRGFNLTLHCLESPPGRSPFTLCVPQAKLQCWWRDWEPMLERSSFGPAVRGSGRSQRRGRRGRRSKVSPCAPVATE